MQRPLMRPEASSAAHGAPSSARGSVVQMSRPVRAVIFTTGGLLWASGVLWLTLHFGFEQQTPFGPLPNPWEPVLMRVHGLLAVVGVFLLGWVASGHVLVRWASARNRLSGLVLAGSAVVLVASGYALYYSTGALHAGAALVHEGLGTAALLAALAHWWRVRTTR